MDPVIELLLIAAQTRGGVTFDFEGLVKVRAIYHGPGREMPPIAYVGTTLREAATKLLGALDDRREEAT